MRSPSPVWCCWFDNVVPTTYGGSPRPNKGIVEGSGHVSGWPGGGTKAPCSSAVLTTPGHLYVPFAKRRKCLSSPFQGGKHCTLTTAEGIQRMPGRVKVSACDAAPSQSVSVESQHKPHTTRLWDVLLMRRRRKCFYILDALISMST